MAFLTVLTLLSPQQRDARVRNVSAAAAVLPDCGVRRVYGHALQQVQYWSTHSGTSFIFSFYELLGGKDTRYPPQNLLYSC